jgi:hypothetical protein
MACGISDSSDMRYCDCDCDTVTHAYLGILVGTSIGGCVRQQEASEALC